MHKIKRQNGICSAFSSIVLPSHWKRIAEACQAPPDPLRPADLEIMESMAWFKANKHIQETMGPIVSLQFWTISQHF
jgi:hypothetical protein